MVATFPLRRPRPINFQLAVLGIVSGVILLFVAIAIAAMLNRPQMSSLENPEVTAAKQTLQTARDKYLRLINNFDTSIGVSRAPGLQQKAIANWGADIFKAIERQRQDKKHAVYREHPFVGALRAQANGNEMMLAGQVGAEPTVSWVDPVSGQVLSYKLPSSALVAMGVAYTQAAESAIAHPNAHYDLEGDMSRTFDAQRELQLATSQKMRAEGYNDVALKLRQIQTFRRSAASVTVMPDGTVGRD